MLHGAGMIGASGLDGAMLMWALLRQHVTLSTRVFQAMQGTILLGAALFSPLSWPRPHGAHHA